MKKLTKKQLRGIEAAGDELFRGTGHGEDDAELRQEITLPCGSQNFIIAPPDAVNKVCSGSGI